MAVQTPVPHQDAQRAEPVLDVWLLSVALVWGLNAVASKWVLQVMGPAGVLLFRYLGCVPLFALAARWAQIRSARHSPVSRGPWTVMLLVGLWVSVQQLVFIYALDWTTASEASLIISIGPVWTALTVALTGLEVITAGNWAGIGAALVGVAMIVLGRDGLSDQVPTRVLGDLAMLISSVLYGTFMAYSKRAMARFGSLQVMSWSFTWGALLVVPAGYRQLVSADWGAFNPTLWGALLFSSFICGGYGFIVWYLAIARTGAARTAVYQYLVPVVALASAAILLGERLSVAQVVGSALVLAGLVLARRPNGAPRQEPQ